MLPFVAFNPKIIWGYRSNCTLRIHNKVQTSLVSHSISNRDPVPTATGLPQEQAATMLDKESEWHFSAAFSKHRFGVWRNSKGKNVNVKSDTINIYKVQSGWLTYNVASENGTWKLRVLDKAFMPAWLKPTRVPAHVMLFANRSRCSFSMPLETIETEVERRCTTKAKSDQFSDNKKQFISFPPRLLL